MSEITSFLKDVMLENSFIYSGITIEGLDFFSAQEIATKEQVIDLLNKLPANLSVFARVKRIIFHPKKAYIVSRDNEHVLVFENDLKKEDDVIRRVRGMTEFDHELIFDEDSQKYENRPMNGNQTIHIFLTKDWIKDQKPESQLKFSDEEITLRTIAHEVAHAIWNAIIYGPDIWKHLEKIDDNEQLFSKLQNFLYLWRILPESNNSIYLWYKKYFIAESKHSHLLVWQDESDNELCHQEDFAIHYEEVFVGKKNIDPKRFKIITCLHKAINLYLKKIIASMHKY